MKSITKNLKEKHKNYFEQMFFTTGIQLGYLDFSCFCKIYPIQRKLENEINY